MHVLTRFEQACNYLHYSPSVVWQGQLQPEIIARARSRFELSAVQPAARIQPDVTSGSLFSTKAMSGPLQEQHEQQVMHAQCSAWGRQVAETKSHRTGHLHTSTVVHVSSSADAALCCTRSARTAVADMAHRWHWCWHAVIFCLYDARYTEGPLMQCLPLHSCITGDCCALLLTATSPEEHCWEICLCLSASSALYPERTPR